MATAVADRQPAAQWVEMGTVTLKPGPVATVSTGDTVARIRACLDDANAAHAEAARLMGDLRDEGWSQRRIASEVGCSQATVSRHLRWLDANGSGSPHVPYADWLDDALHAEPESAVTQPAEPEGPVDAEIVEEPEPNERKPTGRPGDEEPDALKRARQTWINVGEAAESVCSHPMDGLTATERYRIARQLRQASDLLCGAANEDLAGSEGLSSAELQAVRILMDGRLILPQDILCRVPEEPKPATVRQQPKRQSRKSRRS